MRRIQYAASAENNLADIAEFIASESGSRIVARSFIARLRRHCAKLADLPGTLGVARPELLPELRSTPFSNYVIFFRYRQDAVEIVSILESHRDIGAHFAGD